MDTIARTRQLGDQRNLTLYQLAQKCGVSYATLRNSEKRNGQLSVDIIERICSGLGITLAAFFETGGD